jgi:hypothetical protein
MAREAGIVRKLRVDGQALRDVSFHRSYQITQREQPNYRWGTMLRRQRPLYRGGVIRPRACLGFIFTQIVVAGSRGAKSMPSIA